MRSVAALGMGVALTLGTFVGCSFAPYDLCSPDNYPPDASLDPKCFPDAGPDSGDAAVADAAADAPLPGCPGQCVAGPPPEWSFPDLVWIGATPDRFLCPPDAPMNGFNGYADLVAPNPCGACACSAPAGSCELPASLTASADTCAETTAASERTLFDPPPAWDGTCTASDAVPPDQPCANGPCVRSLEIAAPVISEGACVPSALAVPVVPPHFTTVAHSCEGWPGGACAHPDQVCAPPAPRHDGALICIQHAGDVPCPGPENSPYGIRNVVYHGLVDHRVCSPCTCGAPAGSACTAVVSIYPDDACASPPSYVETIDALAPACHDLTPGASLGSKSASPPAYTPGVCAPSGGEPVGAVELLGPSTLCCIHAP